MEERCSRLEVLQTETDDDTHLTFVLKGEDHTLGNALYYTILQNPQVKFCGYSIPHPSECKVNFRIETYGVPAASVFIKGLEDLQNVCDQISSTFQESLCKYRNFPKVEDA